MPQIAHLGLVTARRPLLHIVIKVLLLFVFASCISNTLLYLLCFAIICICSVYLHLPLLLFIVCTSASITCLLSTVTLPSKSGWLGFYKQAVLLKYVCVMYFAFVLATSQRVGFLTSGALGLCGPPCQQGAVTGEYAEPHN